MIRNIFVRFSFNFVTDHLISALLPLRIEFYAVTLVLQPLLPIKFPKKAPNTHFPFEINSFSAKCLF